LSPRSPPFWWSTDLVDWLSELLERDGWQPDALVLLGSVGELPKVASQLEHFLGIPAFAPAEGELALARGAALASAKGPFDAAMVTLVSTPKRDRGRRAAKLKQSGPIAMLATGVLTFVVSSSVALGLHMLPDRDSHDSPAGAQVLNTAEMPTERQAHTPAPEQEPVEPVETSEVEPTPVTETVTQTDPAAAPAPQAGGPKPSLAARILQRLPGSHSVPTPTS
jgi:hypothetical protein